MNDISVSLAATQVVYDRTPGARNAVTASVHNARTTDERVVVSAYVVGATRPAAAAAATGPGAGAPGRGAAAAPPAPLPLPAHLTEVETPPRRVGAGATEQYVVSLHGADVEAGTYEVKVIAYPADRAPEEYSDRGQILRVTVPPRASVPAPPKPKRRWLIAVLVAAVLIAVVAVAMFLTRPRTAVVPNVVGSTLEQALAGLSAVNLVADVQDVVQAGEVGLVIDQFPGAGTELPAGDPVILQVGIADPDPRPSPVPSPFPDLGIIEELPVFPFERIDPAIPDLGEQLRQ